METAVLPTKQLGTSVNRLAKLRDRPSKQHELARGARQQRRLRPARQPTRRWTPRRLRASEDDIRFCAWLDDRLAAFYRQRNRISTRVQRLLMRVSWFVAARRLTPVRSLAVGVSRHSNPPRLTRKSGNDRTLSIASTS
jgi:hypothetical protein